LGRLNILPLGEPPFLDVDAAAKLYLEYENKGLLSDEAAEAFAMTVYDFEAVYSRAVDLKQQAADSDE